MTKYDWLNPLRERARKLEEETKRIREQTEQLRKRCASPSSDNKETKEPTMPSTAKFVTITRTIDPKTGNHYLDGIDDQGRHWTAEMSHRVEPWLVYTKTWKLDPQRLYE